MASLVASCDRLRESSCRCGATPRPGDEERPIEIEDSEMEDYRAPMVETLIPLEVRDKGKGREIAEGTPLLLLFLAE